MTREETAAMLHQKGYNCCQSVACAFADCVDIDPVVLFKLCEGFGLGMGCMEGVCGALSGAVILAGLKNSDGNLEHPASKAATMKLSREMLQEFTSRTHALLCKDLKGAETGKVLCSCPDCIRIATEIAEKTLQF